MAARVPYTPYPTEESGGGGGRPMSVRSSPDAFGAQIGRSVERFGDVGFDAATKFAEEAAESKANDILANQWAPETTKMRTQYESLQGADKVQGYEAYVNGMKEYQKGLVENETNPLTKKILSNYTTRNAIQETERASSDLAEWQKKFNTDSTYKLIAAQDDNAAANYNNPLLVRSIIDQNDAQIERLYIDKGHNPLTPDGSAVIAEAQRTAKGETATKLITRAVQTGDMSTANSLRAEYGTVIPGYQQLHIDNMLGVENLKYTSQQSTQALRSGAPLPQPMGAPPIALQAQVASAAHVAGIDPNTALAYIRIESSDGTNLGKRGTIAQDRMGGTLDEQVARLPAQIKHNEQTATNALGRQAEAWEGYVIHQQGSGGGAALLQAVASGDKRKAVDILKPFEEKEKGYNALAAVVENGGNATMTADDFVGFIKQRYEDCAKRAKCDFDKSRPPGEVILSTYNSSGEAVQPAATPIQALQNFNKKAPGMLERINAIPNTEVRDGVMKEFNRDRAAHTAAAESYSATIQLEAQKLSVKPDFTSTDQIPPEMRAQLLDMPETMKMLQARAEYNQDHASGEITKDMREYGTGYFDLFKRINAPSEDPARISSITEIQKHLNEDLTVAGYDKLVTALTGTRTPEGKAEGVLQKTFLDRAKATLAYSDRDVDGLEKFSAFQAWFFPAYEKAKAEGKTMDSLLNPDSPDYMGKAVDAFNRSPAERLADRLKDPMDYTPPARTPDSIKEDFKSGKITRDAAVSELKKMGYK